jgi:hypothetical protein
VTFGPGRRNDHEGPHVQQAYKSNIVLDTFPRETLPAEPAAQAWSAPELRRYFIVTHGRSGSSLLAAILATCGADFGASCAGDQDTERDHWENRKIDRAIRCAHAANDYFSPSMGGLTRVAYKYWRTRAKALLEAGLRDAAFSKNRWNAVVLPLVEQMNYRPIPIVSYRHPAEVALSDMSQLKNMPSTFMASISRTYLDALYALERYGGVVIDHAELTDPACDEWAYALDAITGLDAGALLVARDRLLKPKRLRRDAGSVWLPSELRSLAQNLLSLRNIPLPTSRRLHGLV